MRTNRIVVDWGSIYDVGHLVSSRVVSRVGDVDSRGVSRHNHLLWTIGYIGPEVVNNLGLEGGVRMDLSRRDVGCDYEAFLCQPCWFRSLRVRWYTRTGSRSNPCSWSCELVKDVVTE